MNIDSETQLLLIAALSAMQLRDGSVSEETILKEASKPESVFHPFVEWDLSKAAKLYQLEQIRQLCEDGTGFFFMRINRKASQS